MIGKSTGHRRSCTNILYGLCKDDVASIEKTDDLGIYKRFSEDWPTIQGPSEDKLPTEYRTTF